MAVSDKKKSEGSWLWENGLLVLLLGINIFLVGKFFTFPFSYAFSAPVIPFLASTLQRMSIDYREAIRWVLLVFYIFGPITLYFLVKEVTGRWMSGILAAILFSLPIFRSRFEALTILGDGAHIAALSVIPLASYWLLRFLKSGNYRVSIAAALMVMLVALISPFGLFVLMVVMTVITFSEMLLGMGRMKFFRFFWVMLISFGFSSFWYNPHFINLSLLSPAGQAVVAAIKNLIPISMVAIPFLGAIGLLIFDRRPQLQPLFIALGLTVVFGLISFAQGLARFAVSGQQRYLPELMMSVAFLWGVVGTFVFDLIGFFPTAKWFPMAKNKRDLLRSIMIVLFSVICLLIIIFSPFELITSRRGRGFSQASQETPVIDIESMRGLTSENARYIGYTMSLVTVGIISAVALLVRKQTKSI